MVRGSVLVKCWFSKYNNLRPMLIESISITSFLASTKKCTNTDPRRPIKLYPYPTPDRKVKIQLQGIIISTSSHSN